MRVKIDDPSLISKSVEIISELVTEVRIKINEFGLSITAIDPANVAMVRFKLPKTAFSQFEAGNESLGVNLDNLKQILKRAGSKSPLILETEENMLKIQIEGNVRRMFTLNLIEIDREDRDIPNLEYSSKVEINSMDLISSLEDCHVVSDSCGFSISNGKFIIDAKNLNSARAEFSGDEAVIDAEDCKSRYSLEYLSKFIKAAKLSEKTRLNFATNHPLKFEVKTNHMEIIFILAPRVENDD